jgi:hypothetical protein
MKYLFPIVLFFIVLLFVTLNYSNFSGDELSIIKSSWTVEKIELNKEDVTNQYKDLTFTLLDDQKLLNPNAKDFKSPYPSQYNKWKYLKKDNFEGLLVIEDTMENIFSGTYEIESLQSGKEKRVLIYNDSIKLYLTHKMLSLENPTVPLDFDLNN